MLKISEQAFGALEVAARPAFAAWVRDALAEKYPQFLPRFPDATQGQIVANMLGRAARWDLTLQNAMLAYCEYMIAIAANFDEDGEINGLLDANRARLDLLVPALDDHVSDEAWLRAEANASNLPFFLPPDLLGQALERRTARAITLALGDRPEAANPNRAVTLAMQDVVQFGLRGLEDGPLVLTACRSFYGDALGWIADLRSEGWQADAMLAAIRLRIALDFGRFL